MSTKVAFVIKGSALKHGVAELEIAHALDHALFWFDMGDFDMYAVRSLTELSWRLASTAKATCSTPCLLDLSSYDKGGCDD